MVSPPPRTLTVAFAHHSVVDVPCLHRRCDEELHHLAGELVWSVAFGVQRGVDELDFHHRPSAAVSHSSQL
jgi:hypothetical protein